MTGRVTDAVMDSVKNAVMDGANGGARRRWAVVGAVAAGVVLAAGGCGVQPTGVHVAQTEPFGPSSSSSPQSAAPTQYPYTVSLFLFSIINKGPGAMINRPVQNALTATDLPNQLARLTTDEGLNQYTTYVPAGIVMKPTSQAHMYMVYSPIRLGPLAQQQLTCTFDQWWIQHPGPSPAIRPTTRLVFANTGEDTGWQDCPDGIVQNSADSATTAAAKPSASEAGGSVPTGG